MPSDQLSKDHTHERVHATYLVTLGRIAGTTCAEFLACMYMLIHLIHEICPAVSASHAACVLIHGQTEASWHESPSGNIQPSSLGSCAHTGSVIVDAWGVASLMACKCSPFVLCRNPFSRRGPFGKVQR